MQAYRFLEDFKQGVGVAMQPYCITAPCPAIYATYETIFKKGDVAQGQLNAGPVQPGNGGIFWQPGFLTTIDFVKNGVKYAVPSSMVTPVSVADAKAETEQNKKWLLIIAVVIVAYFLFKK